MSKLEIFGLIILLLVAGAVGAAAKHRNDLTVELRKLQITETKLSIEKLNYELSIYREQEAAMKQVNY